MESFPSLFLILRFITIFSCVNGDRRLKLPLPDSQRQISWWVNVGESSTTDIANVQTIRDHSNVFSEIQPCWDQGCTNDGNLSIWFTEEDAINAWLSLYTPLNIPLVPSALCIVNSTVMHENLYPNAAQFGQTLVKIAQKYNFQGFTFDYEPQWPPDNSSNSSAMYKDFLTVVNQILVENSLKLAVWVADWSPTLHNFGSLAESGINALQDMETYGGFDTMTTELDFMYEFLNGVNSTMKSMNQACVGLGPFEKSFWNVTRLNGMISNITAFGGTKLCIFRLLMDGQNNWPPDFWWDSLTTFIQG